MVKHTTMYKISSCGRHNEYFHGTHTFVHLVNGLVKKAMTYYCDACDMRLGIFVHSAMLRECDNRGGYPVG